MLKLHALLRFHRAPINQIVFLGAIGKSNLEVSFALNMLSALIYSERSYSALRLVAQPTHQRFVRPGPLVLGVDLLKFPNVRTGYKPNCLTTF
jgi:hypothetical protein